MPADVTQLLNAIDSGSPKAAEELLPLVYEELRRLAGAFFEPNISRLDSILKVDENGCL